MEINIDLTSEEPNSFDYLKPLVKEKLQALKDLGRDRAKGHGGVTIGDLKIIAGALGINKSQKKDILVDLIFNRIKNHSALLEIQKSKFRQNSNTFFRLLNCLMENPEAVARTELLAGRF
jgi:hypothetical protein